MVRTMLLLRCLLMLGSLCGLYGRDFDIIWSSKGVEAYRDPRYDEHDVIYDMNHLNKWALTCDVHEGASPSTREWHIAFLGMDRHSLVPRRSSACVRG